MTFTAPALNKRNLVVPWLPIVVGPLLLFGYDLIRGRALFWGTPLLQFTPWRTIAKELLFSGHLPLWNPWLGMGAPLLANYQSALLYPPNWLLLVVDVAWGQTFLVMVHLMWACAGMALLARRLGMDRFPQAVAGLAFGLSGYLVARAGFLSINAAAAWLPWILLAAEGLVGRPRLRSVAVLGAALALQWLTGHAQTAWYTLLLAGVWVIYRSRSASSWKAALLGLAAAAGLAFAVAGAQLLPTIEYTLVSDRSAELDPEFALTYSFWPWRISGLLAPDLYGNPATGDFWGYGNYWEDAIYIGVLPFLLAVGAILTKRVGHLKWFLLGIGVVSFALALGQNTPMYIFLFENVPTFSAFQAPARWNLWLVFALALLAGLGAQYWSVARGRWLYWLRLGTTGAGVLLVVAGVLGQLPTPIEPTFPRALSLTGVWLLASGLMALTRREPAVSAWTGIALAVIVADLFLAGRGLNPTLPAGINSSPSALSERVSNEGRLYMPAETEQEIKFEVAFRFDSFQPELDWWVVRNTGLPNTTALAELRSANNFDPIVPARFAAWMAGMATVDESQFERLVKFMDVGWTATGVDPLYEPVAGPIRAWVVPQMDWVADPVTAVSRAMSSGFDPAELVLLEGPDPEGQIIVGGKGVVVEVRDDGPNRIEMIVDAPQGGWLVLADTWYPGWEAAVDGVPTESYPANGAFRAVWVTSGRHAVTYQYRPISVPVGFALSALGLLSLAILYRR